MYEIAAYQFLDVETAFLFFYPEPPPPLLSPSDTANNWGETAVTAYVLAGVQVRFVSHVNLYLLVQ